MCPCSALLFGYQCSSLDAARALTSFQGTSTNGIHRMITACAANVRATQHFLYIAVFHEPCYNGRMEFPLVAAEGFERILRMYPSLPNFFPRLASSWAAVITIRILFLLWSSSAQSNRFSYYRAQPLTGGEPHHAPTELG